MLSLMRERNMSSLMDRIQRANDLGYYALDDDHVYDIDTLKISNLHVDWLPLLTYGIVDIAGREPYVPELKHLDEDLGLCIVSAPMYISLSHVTKKRTNTPRPVAQSPRTVHAHIGHEQPIPQLWAAQVSSGTYPR